VRVRECLLKRCVAPGRSVPVVTRSVPLLPSRDLRETLGVYESLSFENRGAPPKEWDSSIPVRDGAEFHFIGAPNLDPLTTASSCFVFVDDADALHQEWSDIGVREDPATGSRLEAPTDTAYGMGDFTLVDLRGNLVRVGSPLTPYPTGTADVAPASGMFPEQEASRLSPFHP